MVEILSLSDTRRALTGKIADYCAIGVRECWGWLLSTASGREGRIRITSIACTLLLAEVYDRVPFPQEPRREAEKGQTI